METQNGIKNKMRIAHIITGDTWAGAEVVTYELLRSLVNDKNIDLTAIILNEGIVYEKIASLGIKTYFCSDELSFFSLVRKVSTIVKKNTINICSSYNSYTTRLLICAFGFLVVLNSFADIHYVSKIGSDTSPYTSWETAARVIQDAIDVASVGDTVFVNDGTYSTGGDTFLNDVSNRVVIAKSIIVESRNGPKFTIIQGTQSDDSGTGGHTRITSRTR